MADWPTIASLATAGGTLVLAVATFGSVRSANRAAAVAERSLRLSLRPVLVCSRPDDPPEKVPFVDDRMFELPGGAALVEESDGVIYMAIALRNVGSGLAVLDGWYARAGRVTADVDHAPPDEFRTLRRDLYVPAGDTGYWHGAIRAPDDPMREPVRRALVSGDTVTIELVYSDHERGQRSITRFAMSPRDGDTWFCAAGRHWTLD